MGKSLVPRVHPVPTTGLCVIHVRGYIYFRQRSRSPQVVIYQLGENHRAAIAIRAGDIIVVIYEQILPPCKYTLIGPSTH